MRCSSSLVSISEEYPIKRCQRQGLRLLLGLLEGPNSGSWELVVTTWSVSVEWCGELAQADLDRVAALLAASVVRDDAEPDVSRAWIGFSVEANSLLEAFEAAARAEELASNLLDDRPTLSALELRDPESPSPSWPALGIPSLVGYVEIAEMAQVSRQRARQLANLKDFPKPVQTLSAGPLRIRSAVAYWLKSWKRKTGRPPKP